MVKDLTINIDEKISSVKFFVDEEFPHLRVKNHDLCLQCGEKFCLNFCPAGVYRLDSQGRIIVGYQACLECGSCRVGCPSRNIEWSYPRGGYGVNYKFG